MLIYYTCEYKHALSDLRPMPSPPTPANIAVPQMKSETMHFELLFFHPRHEFIVAEGCKRARISAICISNGNICRAQWRAFHVSVPCRTGKWHHIRHRGTAKNGGVKQSVNNRNEVKFTIICNFIACSRRARLNGHMNYDPWHPEIAIFTAYITFARPHVW